MPAQRRQRCWPRLKRDLQKIVDGGGPRLFVGRRGRILVKKVFAAWHAFPEGQTPRAQLKEQLTPLRQRMQRLLRRAVLWRKRSFGCGSAAGCRLVERILTVVPTRRLQGNNVLDYLHEALVAHRSGQPSPKLLPQG